MKANRFAWSIVVLMASISPSVGEDEIRIAERADAPASPEASAGANAGEANASMPVAHVRSATFPIPFNVDQGDAAKLEVLLYVSVDRGAKWLFYARQKASAAEIPFRAGGDGEYWFASQTLLNGAPAASNPSFSPQLKVNVDTREPRVGLNAQINSQGQITAAWEVFDEFLAPQTLKLEYQGGPGQAWKDVEIERPAEGSRETSLKGQTGWTPASLDKMATVRLEVRDYAGNLGSLTRRLIVPITLAFRRTPTTSMNAASVPSDPFQYYGVPRPGSAGVAAAPAAAAVANAASDAPPAASANDATVGGGMRSTTDTVASGDESYEVAKAETPDPEAVRWPASGDDGFDSDPNASAYPPARSPVGPPVAHNADSSGEEYQDGEASGGADDAASNGVQQDYGVPPGERPQMTRVRRFNLDYSVDAVGPGGVEKVELWITRNSGRDWELWGVDEDRETPLLVDMESEPEGIYGFRIVIVGNNGLASQTPRSGEPADLWIGIDSTQPEAEITTAAYGAGADAGHLDIQWNVQDDYLGPRPITLKFSDDPDGEWTTIAAGLRNTGQYLWRVDSRIPEQFYLRLEARDEAGNVAVYDLDQPLASAGMTPKGHIRTVAPVSEEP